MSRLEQMLSFLEQDPNDSFSRYAVALELNSLRRRDEAIEMLRELRRRDPEYVATYYQLGQIHSTLEQFDEAEEEYREGMVIARKIRDTHTLGELEAALDELESLR